MRISDDERREVAARLRERTKKPMGESMQRMLTETLGMYAHNIGWMNADKATNRWDVIVNYLADLIDRPTCTMTYKPEWSDDEIYPTSAYQCSNCGSVVNEGITEYCPSCGCRVSNFETES